MYAYKFKHGIFREIKEVSAIKNLMKLVKSLLGSFKGVLWWIPVTTLCGN